MKLKLSISKKFVNRASGTTEEFIFAVIDLNKAKNYPANFVCLLPKTMERSSKQATKFFEIYGEESQPTAIKLLTNALRTETDIKVRNEIEQRLKSLKPKPVLRAQCAICGCTFEPRKVGRFVQRVCQACKK